MGGVVEENPMHIYVIILLLPVVGIVVFWFLPLSKAIPAYVAILLVSGLIYWFVARALKNLLNTVLPPWSALKREWYPYQARMKMPLTWWKSAVNYGRLTLTRDWSPMILLRFYP